MSGKSALQSLVHIAANGGFEPRITDAASCSNGGNARDADMILNQVVLQILHDSKFNRKAHVHHSGQ